MRAEGAPYSMVDLIHSGRRGRLVTVEGIEGAGKSTHVKTICSTLNARGIENVATREPGGTPVGERLRDLLLSAEIGDVGADAELLLMFAARAEHVMNVVRPALEMGRWVVSDRFADASYAYQGGGRGCDPARLVTLDRLVCAEIRPDLTFLLDIPPEQAAARVADRGEKDRFESESTDFFEQVREAYLARAREDAGRWRVINAGRGLAQVQAEIRREVEAFVAEETRT